MLTAPPLAMVLFPSASAHRTVKARKRSEGATAEKLPWPVIIMLSCSTTPSLTAELESVNDLESVCQPLTSRKQSLPPAGSHSWMRPIPAALRMAALDLASVQILRSLVEGGRPSSSRIRTRVLKTTLVWAGAETSSLVLVTSFFLLYLGRERMCATRSSMAETILAEASFFSRAAFSFALLAGPSSSISSSSSVARIEAPLFPRMTLSRAKRTALTPLPSELPPPPPSNARGAAAARAARAARMATHLSLLRARRWGAVRALRRGEKAESSALSPLATRAAMTWTASLACSGVPSLTHRRRSSSWNCLSSALVDVAEAEGAMAARILEREETMLLSSASSLALPLSILVSEKNSVRVLKHSPLLPWPIFGKAVVANLTMSRKWEEV
mmetsp:Transcript_6566/g.11897  ORF Transcript_6566/g.11897 Transcript_6566/m.11897 type:complete len:387 (-) Transcript_6566:2075-3235(-)